MKKSGFTLIEIMVVMAIFMIVISASYALLTSGRISWYSGDAKIQLQEDLRQSMDYMSSEISESAPTKLIVGGSSITFQVPVDENGSGSWQDTDTDGQNDYYLERTLDNSGAINWGAYLRREDKTAASSSQGFGLRTGRSVAFLLSQTNLIRRVTDGSGLIIEDFRLANGINSITFTRTAENVVTIRIAGRKVALDLRPMLYDLETSVYLRNRE